MEESTAKVRLSLHHRVWVRCSVSGGKEVVWMRRLLQDLGRRQDQPTELFIDNQSAIKLARNSEFHQRTKHIDVKFHFIRDLQENQVINSTYINTENQLADLLTKGLDGPHFRKLRQEIGIYTVTSAWVGVLFIMRNPMYQYQKKLHHPFCIPPYLIRLLALLYKVISSVCFLSDCYHRQYKKRSTSALSFVLFLQGIDSCWSWRPFS